MTECKIWFILYTCQYSTEVIYSGSDQESDSGDDEDMVGLGESSSGRIASL